MNQENFELALRAVEAAALSSDALLLEQLRITSSKELQPMSFLFRIFGKPCFPRGELVAVTGKAKSGKTLFTTMLMAVCARDEVLQIQHPFDEVDNRWVCLPYRCLWYDTEQSEQSTQDILKNRLIPLTGKEGAEAEAEKMYDIFNVRSLHCEERLRLFEVAVSRCHPDLVILDGVRDLLYDINDGIKAQQVVEQLMQLAQRSGCCIVCVLHQNKGAEDRNLRGWIGTELMNKAFEVYACEKTKPANIFAVEQTHTRKYDLEEMLFFRMDGETGLPVEAEAPVQYASGTAAPAEGKKLPPMNRDYIWFDDQGKVHVRKHDLFYAVLKAGALCYNDLQAKVISLLGCGTPLWNNMFSEMRDSGYVVRTKDQRGRTVWKLATVSSQPETRQLDMYNEPAPATPDQA